MNLFYFNGVYWILKGYNHIVLTLIYGLPFIFAFSEQLHWNAALPFMIIFLIIGSLLPDVDAQDATIFHGYYTPIGYLFKYCLYLPIALFMNNKKHRGLFHSIQGLILALVSTGLIGILLYLLGLFSGFFSTLLQHTSIFSIFVEIFIGIELAISIGFFFHLLQDSQTASGINWIYNSDILQTSGVITVGSKSESLLVIILMLTSVIQVYWLFLSFHFLLILFLSTLQFILVSNISNRFFAVF